MRQRVLYLSGLFILIMLLSGCIGNSTTDTPAKRPLETTVITKIKSITPSSSPTSLSPSKTPEPTITLEPTWTPIPAEILGVMEKYNCYDYILESPSGEWLYFRCQAPIGAGSSSVLYDRDTGKSWLYLYCTFYNKCESEKYSSEGHLLLKAWSPDGKYLYVSMTSGGDGGVWFDLVSKLISINLDTGIASIFIDTEAVYSFSPDKNRLAYIVWPWEGPNEVIVRDLRDSSDFKLILEPKYDQSGDIIWSPDGTQFVFLALDLDEEQDPISYSLMLVDVADRSRAVLIKDYPDYLTFQEWLPGGVLKYIAIGEITYDITYSIPDRQLFVTPQP